MFASLSIQQRLSAFAASFTLIVFALSVATISGLHAIDENLETLEGRLLRSSQILAQIAHHTADFRLAEIDLALASDDGERALAASAVQKNRSEIAALGADFIAVEGQDEAALAPFQSAWRMLLLRHDDWVRQLGKPRHDSTIELPDDMKALHIRVDDEIETLYGATFQQVHGHAEGVDALIHKTIDWTTGLSIGGILLAGLLIYRARVMITRPLRAMTQTLTKLSRGDREVVLPALNRDDEIGDMAKAFEVFRANALALEAAHAATRLAQEEAQMLARHDALTGLPNRRVFTNALEDAVARTQAGSQPCSVLMIDLDRFKPINDTLGHAVGDLVLCEVATRLKSVLGRGDLAARLGGDEFAVILKDDQQDHDAYAQDVAQKALALLEQPISVNGTSVEISATIGIASCPSAAAEPEALLRAADLALYQGKRDGRSRLCWFEPQMEEILRLSADLEKDLRAAIENEEIKPFYQPLVSMKDGHIYGFEMLARWHDKLRGDISPEIFVPLAEQMGLISAMTWPLLRQACRDARDWPTHMTLSINLSAVQLKDADLPVQILAVLSGEGFSPRRLEVEITETALVADFEMARGILEALRAAGVKTALDDFGAGYSNLYMLRELNFDKIKIKIDRSFVMAMQRDRESEGIVSAVISLARNLGLPAVAEGVDTKEIVKMLADLGCELGQGYLYGKPTPAALAKALAIANIQKAI
ncbi:EAL domain-containing protein [Rhizobium sp. Leaf386]|uniref:putative bifunctional diguanylate cyclase/phosphodiesterase n=1 Tax=Rhizobium sp. Leaf386 TaxID=1736359 RepID=UPI000713CF57|nr:EAL domain-containing protein [Rhizobium sp. Leaf386]KQS83593.1 hypothetical protein ASG50_31150 [Rhizobium sp. Leaf386]